MNSKLYQIRVLRYALGVTLAMAISQGYAWLLSYLVPVLILGFLVPPAIPLSIKGGLKFLLVIGIASFTGILIAKLVNFPLVYLPLMFLTLMHLFYAKETAIPPLLKTWLLISILLIPMMALSSQNLSLIVARLLFFGALVGVLITWLVYIIIPNPKGVEKQLEEKQIKKPLSDKERFYSALESTMVIFPIMMAFNIFQWTGGILILIFVAILASMPALSKDLKVGKFLIVGNTIGGIVSILFYNIMTVIPEFYFLLLLTFLIALTYGIVVMSGKPIGKVFATAFSTTLIILGSVFASEDDAGSIVWVRVGQIFIAVLYVVLAFGFIGEWKKHFNSKKIRLRLKRNLTERIK